MFYGYNTTGAVALKLMERYGRQAPWFIHRILFDCESWREPYNCTSYLWWRFIITEDGLDMEIQGGGKEHNYHNFPEVEFDTLYNQGEAGWNEGYRGYLDAMLKLGLQPFQWVLSTWRMEVSQGSGYYDDDYDANVYSKIIFVEPLNCVEELWLPLRDRCIVSQPVLYGIQVQEPEMAVEEKIEEAAAA